MPNAGGNVFVKNTLVKPSTDGLAPLLENRTEFSSMRDFAVPGCDIVVAVKCKVLFSANFDKTQCLTYDTIGIWQVLLNTSKGSKPESSMR